MATVVALDSSPANVLRSMRGAIVDARLGYPGILHVEIEDSAGRQISSADDPTSSRR